MQRLTFGLALVAAVLVSTSPAFAHNKAQLVDSFASSSDLSKADAKRALDAFINTTSGALKKGDRVALVGFGSFSISKRATRTGRNPQTGKAIKIGRILEVKDLVGSQAFLSAVESDGDGVINVEIAVPPGSESRIIVPVTLPKAVLKKVGAPADFDANFEFIVDLPAGDVPTNMARFVDLTVSAAALLTDLQSVGK